MIDTVRCERARPTFTNLKFLYLTLTRAYEFYLGWRTMMRRTGQVEAGTITEYDVCQSDGYYCGGTGEILFDGSLDGYRFATLYRRINLHTTPIPTPDFRLLCDTTCRNPPNARSAHAPPRSRRSSLH